MEMSTKVDHAIILYSGGDLEGEEKDLVGVAVSVLKT